MGTNKQVLPECRHGFRKTRTPKPPPLTLHTPSSNRSTFDEEPLESAWTYQAHMIEPHDTKSQANTLEHVRGHPQHATLDPTTQDKPNRHPILFLSYGISASERPTFSMGAKALNELVAGRAAQRKR